MLVLNGDVVEVNYDDGVYYGVFIDDKILYFKESGHGYDNLDGVKEHITKIYRDPHTLNREHCRVVYDKSVVEKENLRKEELRKELEELQERVEKIKGMLDE